jgi:hypothetical protein
MFSMFSPCALVRVRALKGMACRACQVGLVACVALLGRGARIAYVPCLWLRQSILRTLLVPSMSLINGFNQPLRSFLTSINHCDTAGYLRFHPIAQCAVHALKGLACRARVTPASSPASLCKQCSALTSPALHARGCASPSCSR